MRKALAKRALHRRIIALLAAYAIALASLVASFGAVQAAIGAVDGAVICHTDAQGAPASGSHNDDGTICFKSCIGCMTSLATVIPPTIAVSDPPQLSFKRLDLPALSFAVASAKSNAHRSRGPPQVL